MKLPGTRQVNKICEQLEAAGAEVTRWTKDGSGDSAKIALTVNDCNFIVAVEAMDDLQLASCNDYEYKSVGDVKGLLATLAINAISA